MEEKRARGRKGRGYLSSIELLPPECADAIDWARDELRKRERTQTDIYEEFHARLEAVMKEHRGELEFTIPSFSSFNRFSLNLAAMTRRIEQTAQIASTLADKFDAEQSDNLTVIAAEAIKTLVFELLTDAGESGIEPKGAMQLAAALRAASQAQGVSTLRRQRVDAQLRDGVEDAVGKVQKETGMSDETAQAIIDKVLGRPPDAKGNPA